MDKPCKKISLCICTHNRIFILPRAIESIKAAALLLSENERSKLELLIIANACSDETLSLAPPLIKTFPIDAKLIEERKVGLTVARNRAIRESNAEFVAFFDDDSIIEDSWIKSFLKADKDFPDAAVFGGPLVAIVDQMHELPAGLIKEFVRFKKYPRGFYPDPKKDYPVGGNCAIRRSLALKAGFYSEELGRKGDIPFDCDEKDFYRRLIERGFDRFVYDPGMIVRHGPLSSDFHIYDLLKGYFFTGMSLYKLEKNSGKSNYEIFKERFFFKSRHSGSLLRHLKFLLNDGAFMRRTEDGSHFDFFHENHEVIKERLVYLGMRYAQLFK